MNWMNNLLVLTKAKHIKGYSVKLNENTEIETSYNQNEKTYK